MFRLQSPRFNGTFRQLDTYSLAMNAAPRAKGIATEEVLGLMTEATERFKDVFVLSDPYQSPATLRTEGRHKDVEQADEWFMEQFNKRGVHFDYYS